MAETTRWVPGWASTPSAFSLERVPHPRVSPNCPSYIERASMLVRFWDRQPPRISFPGGMLATRS